MKTAMTKSGARGSGWGSGVMAVAVIWALILAMPIAFGDPPPLELPKNLPVTIDTLYLGYMGKRWDRDFGVLEGRCNRRAVSAVLGRVAGGAIGSPVAKGDGRQVATVVGVVVGASVGRNMDDKDRACVGHTLELAGVERNVVWTNTDHGIVYHVIPLGGYADNGRSCREFVTRIDAGGHNETVRHKACSSGDGVWQIVG